MRKVVRKTYDENGNFVGEFIQIFDESGKQIAGHKLTHDPWAGNLSLLGVEHCRAGLSRRGMSFR